MSNKKSTSFWLSSEAKAMLKELATDRGCGQNHVIERWIRNVYKRHLKDKAISENSEQNK